MWDWSPPMMRANSWWVRNDSCFSSLSSFEFQSQKNLVFSGKPIPIRRRQVLLRRSAFFIWKRTRLFLCPTPIPIYLIPFFWALELLYIAPEKTIDSRTDLFHIDFSYWFILSSRNRIVLVLLDGRISYWWKGWNCGNWDFPCSLLPPEN